MDRGNDLTAPPSRRAPLRTLLIALAMLGAGCSGGAGSTSSDTGPSGGLADYQMLPLRSGPLLGILTTRSIDRHGKPEKVRRAFAPTEKQIVATVAVGSVPAGSRIEITWEAYSASAVLRTLFAQTVTVKSNQKAFSTAVLKGPMGVGAYRVRASLGSDNIAAPFSIEEPVAGSAAAADPDPVPGDSGADDPVDEPEPTPRVPQPCTKARHVYGESLGGGLSIEADASGDSLFCTGLVLGARVTGPYRVVGSGDSALAAIFNACDLSGGTDLAGTNVDIEGYIPGHEGEAAHATTQLLDPNPFPLLHGFTMPIFGSIVHPGDTVQYEIAAGEIGFTSGIKSVSVSTNLNTKRDEVRASKQVPCTLDHYYRKVAGSFTIPSNPPPIVDMTLEGTDFAGKHSSHVLHFPTGPEWKGTIVSTTSRLYTDNAGTPRASCETSWTTTVDFAVVNGKVGGSGDARLMSVHCSVPGADSYQIGSFHFAITGKRTGDAFSLRIAYADTAFHGRAETAGFTLIQVRDPCDPGSAPTDLALQIENGAVKQQLKQSATQHCAGGAADGFSATHTFDLYLAQAPYAP